VRDIISLIPNYIHLLPHDVERAVDDFAVDASEPHHNSYCNSSREMIPFIPYFSQYLWS
jgi:hypothetical protein